MLKSLKRHQLLFICATVFFLGLFLRTYLLASVPPSLHLDEISFGYNAYSLMLTGKDEFGSPLPLILRSFDDYRPAVFSYLMIPFIKVFGLSTTSFRLTSVVLSFMTLICLYIIVMLLLSLSQKRNKLSYENSQKIAFCSVFLYSICPWSVFMSRLAIDANAGLTFFLIAFTLFLSFLHSKKSWTLPLAFLFFAVAFYSYNGIKIFVVLFLAYCFFLFYKQFLTQKKQVILSVLFLLILFIPIISTYRNPANLQRFTYLNAFTQNRNQFLSTSSERLVYDYLQKNRLGYFFDNRRFASFPFYLNNYLMHLNPTWLYGDDFSHYNYKVPNFGLFYVFELPLFAFGIYSIFKKNLFTKQYALLLVGWFFLSIVPAAMTIDTPSSVRIYTILPVFLVIEGCGMYFIMQSILQQKSILKKLFFSLLGGGAIIFSVLCFFHAYFTLFPYYASSKYQYGEEEALVYAKLHESAYKDIVVSNRESLAYSYIYYLYINKYSPQKYLQEGGTKDGSIYANHVMGKYVFVKPVLFPKNTDDPNKEFLSPNVLYVVNENDLPQTEEQRAEFFQKVIVLKKITYLNNQPAITIFTVK